MHVSIKSSVKCSKCGFISYSLNNDHTQLELEIPLITSQSYGNLKTCIDSYCATETISYTCEKFKHKGKCEKKNDIIRSNYVLVFQIKR